MKGSFFIQIGSALTLFGGVFNLFRDTFGFHLFKYRPALPPVLLQLLVHALHGLLGVESQPILLSFHQQELVNMGLQNVDL